MHKLKTAPYVRCRFIFSAENYTARVKYCFVLTQTHTHSVKESEYGRLAEEWNEHVSREATVWAAFHRHWLSARTPLLAIRYEDLLDSQRRAETLQLVAAFLYARAAPADGASPEAAAAALRGMLSRVQAAAREAADVQHAEAAEGVYQPRRGGVGGGQKRFSAEQRAEPLRALHLPNSATALGNVLRVGEHHLSRLAVAPL